jgi:predicted DsbA family dithiol-disulfide isomerase
LIIDVWSDVVCPWCFIGRRRLQKALTQFSHRDNVVVRHRAFQLQPDISEVVPTTAYLASKYGAPESKIAEMQANVCQIADGEGLCYKLGETFSGNTVDAHRLLLMAAELGKQDELLEAMYHGYFEEGRSLFSPEDLLVVIDEVGIDHERAHALLISDQYRVDVDEDAQMARALGASGVPFFVFDMRYAISGAQPLDAFTQTLEAAWQGEVEAEIR